MQTRSQQYSQIVYGQINNLGLPVDKKTYGSICHNFPLMVLKSGLSQAVAFMLVKAKLHERDDKQSKPHKFFLENLADLSGLELDQGIKAVKFQEKINTLDLMEYMRITRKILAASIWYKRFAESILGVKADNNDEVESGDN